MSPGSQEVFNAEDRKKFIKDGIFYIITQESKRPMFKKADIFRAIGWSGREKNIQEEIWKQIRFDLKDVFGYDLKESQDKKGFFLVNVYSEHSQPELRHLKVPEDEQANTALLTVVLSVIYMNNGSMKQDALFNFLKELKVHDEDKREASHFGNVKNLIENDWGKKQHYIQVDKDPNADVDHPTNIYSWGERAHVEVNKSDILKFVAETYEKEVKEFTEQYESIRNEEGENAFERDEN